MELSDSLYVRAYFAMDGMPDWNRVTVPGMYMIQIIFRDREHVLEQESGTPAIKLSEDDGEAAAVFLDLFVMEGLNLSTRLLKGTIQRREVFSSFAQ